MAKTSFELIVGTKKIQAAVSSIARRNKKLQQDTHVAACSIIAHIEQHNDITQALPLMHALRTPTGRDTHASKALFDWFLEYCTKLAWNEEEKKFVYNKEGVVRLEEAIETPYWELEPEPTFKPFNLDIELAKLIDKAKKRAAKEDERDSIDSDSLDNLANMLSTVNPSLFDAQGNVVIPK